MSRAEIAHAVVDADGRLIEADDALLGLVMRAGGGLARPLAVPQLATVARLARRLQVPIARSVVVADRDADVELFVRAEADGDVVRLAAAGWRERKAWRPIDPAARLDVAGTAADWRWTCDAGLRLDHLSPDAGVRHGFDAVGLLGRPLTDLFAFQPDASGELPILDALANRRSFDAQPARLKGGGRAVLVSALARTDPRGLFAGFAGGVVAAPSAEGARPVAGAIGDRLERALRGPLGRIIANADSIQSANDGPLGSDYAGYAADIANAGRHLLGLVDDLADLEAVERPDFRPELEPIDLADLARRAAGLLSVRAANAGVTIARPGFDERVPAIGDFRRTLQILVNLIGNAVRYSPEGATVDIAVHADARLTVVDHGKGIAVEDQARIFEKFERVDPTEPGGTGLGLYISRRLAVAMGGDLSVESAPGEGARFTLTLRPGE